MTNEQKYKNIHVFNDPKFSKGFFEFLLKYDIDLSDDYLFHYRQTIKTGASYGMHATFSANFFSIIPNLKLLRLLFQSKKIILHSAASPFLLLYLWLFPSLGKKTFWVIWGKDLYFYQTLENKHFYHKVYEFLRIRSLKNIKHIITFTKGDYDLATEWYGCRANWYKSFMYTTNLVKNIEAQLSNESVKTVLVGNSADPSNHHEEVFELLKPFKHENIKIVAPLSYGDKYYAKKIIEKGKQIFGRKFIAFESLIPIDEYNQFLNSVNIGIFAHKRQQAMGNIITLLGMKKTVCISKNITSWDTLSSLGIELICIEDFNLQEQPINIRERNSNIIKEVYSEQNLLKQWLEIENQDPTSFIKE